MSLLEVSGISVEEDGNPVLKGISFTQSQFCNIAIAGETGSGKSTLLQVIAGLVQPKTGDVLFEGEKVLGPHDVLVPGHPGIAYLSQQYDLPQFLRVEQILKYANTLPDEDAEELYEICRISHLLKRRTNQLSGGEKQRIALARLLTSSPSLLLLDEPYSNLDMVHKQTLKAVIRDISDSLEITCILISHDPADTLSWADEILVMRNGQLLQQGSPGQVYAQPVNEYTAGLFGKYNLVPPSLVHAAWGLANSKVAGKQYLVRPEYLRLKNDPKGGVPVEIENVLFYGSHFEYEVILENTPLTVRAQEQTFSKGDTVFLELLPESLWLV